MKAKCQCGNWFDYDPNDPHPCPDCREVKKEALGDPPPFYKKASETRGWRLLDTQHPNWLMNGVFNRRDIQGRFKKVAGGFAVEAETFLKPIYFINKMEANYWRYLNWLKKGPGESGVCGFRHQPPAWDFKQFDPKIKRNSSYRPDFWVNEMDMNKMETRHHWVELKGYMSDDSKTKLNRAAKYYPSRELRVITWPQYRELEKAVSGAIPGWEG